MRSYATVGAALATASVIAVAPMAPPVPEAAARAASPAVALSATFDPITPWLEVFNDSEINTAGLVNYLLEAPLPVVQQVTSNWIYYITHLDTLGDSLQQIGENIQAGLAAPFVADPALLDASHATTYALISGLVPEDLAGLVSFIASPASGMLVGFLGTIISPIMALRDGIQAAGDFIQDGQWVDALNAFNNIPAEMTGAFLNGYGTLDLSALIPLLQDQLPLGTITRLDMALGGLLSPGGSLFNSVGLTVKQFNIPVVNLTGVPTGLFGSMLAASQAIAKAIGWDGDGNPLAPPLTPPYGDDSAPAAVDEVPASVTDPEASLVAVSLDTTTTPEADAPAEGAEVEVAADPEAATETAAEPETAPETEAEPETAPEAEVAEAEAETAPEAEAEPETAPEAEAEPETAPEAEVAEAEAEAEAAGAGTETDSGDSAPAADAPADAPADAA